MYRFLLIFVFLSVLAITGCTKEEAPAPLPPPVKQVESPAEPKREALSVAIGNDLVKKEVFVGQNDTPQVGEDCNSICGRITDCVKDFAASRVFRSKEDCVTRCGSMPDTIKSAISKSKDCNFVRCNTNRYLCDIACKDAARCNNGNIPKQMGSNMANCLKGCMDMFLMNDRVSRTLACFARSNECSNISSCIAEDISPAKSIEEYCK